MAEMNKNSIWEMVKNDSSMSEEVSESNMETAPFAQTRAPEQEPQPTASTYTPSAPEAPLPLMVDVDLTHSVEGISEDLLSLAHYKVDDCDNIQNEEMLSIQHDLMCLASPTQDGEVNVGASVAAGAVAGLLLGGPFLSMLAAAGASVYVKKEGPAADVVRAGGEIALAVRDTATRLNEKHDFVNKTKEAASDARRKFWDYDEEHQVIQKLREFLYTFGSKAVELERKHHLLENILSCVSRGAARLADKLTQHENPPPTAPVPVPTALPVID